MSQQKPKRFDYNLLVLGAGSGGLVSAYIAAALKAKVGLIEKHKMGGDCLNTGCVPSKALIRSAKILNYIKRHKEFGLSSAEARFEFSEVMERVQKLVKTIEPHDSIERYTKLGVECIQGTGTIISPYEVKVGDKVYSARSIIIATGARPLVPPIPGLNDVPFLTSDTLWDLRKQPKNLAVLGGGPIGVELAQCFQRLGTNVSLIERSPRILPREDHDVSTTLTDCLKAEGMTLLTGHTARAFHQTDGRYTVETECQGKTHHTEFDHVLIALGRKANVEGFGLEELGIELTDRKTIKANEFLATNYKNIFVCGDVAGPYQFTHTASHQAYYACINSLFSFVIRYLPKFLKKPLKVDYSVIPWATYSDPEVSTVGYTETSARAAGLAFEITKYQLDDLDRAITDSETHGFVKVLTVPGKDKILGATIVGHNSSSIISEFILAMKHGLGLNAIMGTIHIYPSLPEANKFAAGVWKKAHSPLWALKLLERFHKWRRS